MPLALSSPARPLTTPSTMPRRLLCTCSKSRSMLPSAHAELREVPLRVVVGVRRLHHRLGRDAADVEAGAARPSRPARRRRRKRPAARRGSPLDSRPALSRGRRDRTPCWVPFRSLAEPNVAGGNASPPRPGSSTMRAVTPLAEQWDAILSEQPGDWSQLRLELRLADALAHRARVRRARAAQPVAPRRRLPHRHPALHGRVALRLRLVRGLVRTRLGQLDGEDIGGSLTLLGGIEAVEPVATQGPA